MRYIITSLILLASCSSPGTPKISPTPVSSSDVSSSVTTPVTPPLADWDSLFKKTSEIIFEHRTDKMYAIDKYKIRMYIPMYIKQKHGIEWGVLNGNEQEALRAWAVAGVIRHPEWNEATFKQCATWSEEGLDEGCKRLLASGFDQKARCEFNLKAEEEQAKFQGYRARNN